jgi:hypothetical protein
MIEHPTILDDVTLAGILTDFAEHFLRAGRVPQRRPNQIIVPNCRRSDGGKSISVSN